MKINSLQIFRGGAALLVLFHHIMQQFYGFERTNALGDFFSDYGHIGVDIFFVISGFIMTFSLYNRNVTAIQFIRNRIVRIVPAYYIFTFLFLLFTINDESSSAYYSTIKSVLLSLIFIPHENPAPFLGVYPTLTVGWTLNVEVFFYLILAIFIGFKFKLSTVLLATSTILLVFPILYRVLDLEFYKEVIGNLRLVEFVSGIIICCLYLKYQRVVMSSIVRLLCVFAIMIAIFIDIPQLVTDIIVSSFLILLALSVEEKIKNSNLFVNIGTYLGNISYSIYLSHPLVLTLFIYNFNFSHMSDFERACSILLVFILTVVVSHVSYIYIENRISGFFSKSKKVTSKVNCS